MDSRGGSERPAKEKLPMAKAKPFEDVPEPVTKTDPRFLVAAEVGN